MTDPTNKPARILIVDDSIVNRMLLSRELEKQGHQFKLAENGKVALEILTAENYDLILLDIEMPELDGYQTLAHLKKDDKLRHLPVIMVTAIDDLASAVRCIELGADDYLPKPFDPVLLRARVSASLEKKRLRDREQAHLRSLERELEIGHDIQLSFLPAEIPQIDGWEIAASLKSAREVAGDFYDVFETDGNICLVIGDVCDKGVGAALFMTLFRSLLRFTVTAKTTLGKLSPAEKLNYAVTMTNNYVANTHGDTGMFATVFIGLLDPKSGALRYINAGHERPILISKHSDDLQALKTTGAAIGVMPDWEYTVEEIRLNKNDLLFGFTDGVPEVEDEQGTFFGKTRLFEILNNKIHSPSELLDKINEMLNIHLGDAKQFDDITLIAAQRSPEK